MPTHIRIFCFYYLICSLDSAGICEGTASFLFLSNLMDYVQSYLMLLMSFYSCFVHSREHIHSSCMFTLSPVTFALAFIYYIVYILSFVGWSLVTSCDFLFWLFNYISSLCSATMWSSRSDSRFYLFVLLGINWDATSTSPVRIWGSITDDPFIYSEGYASKYCPGSGYCHNWYISTVISHYSTVISYVLLEFMYVLPGPSLSSRLISRWCERQLPYRNLFGAIDKCTLGQLIYVFYLIFAV